ncbi:hypothetical protein CORT_0D06610 [Candida orthopsilosis Co 90-125]|uniref:Uncharacterized protein n=1 Tax=Candida orthopsilosis (strain 90-125) TaxID=1136231 RepID=H8X5N7_CANO9|nr:hypothetical protein CORT_0D06610 [Candida orthopsilosis Co 90-125]CCG23495.1 hypothetical protein CORT_0D06610 [Candida orthopsilosis Co 90-125]
MSPIEQTSSIQATKKSKTRPPVPFKLTLYPPSLRPNPDHITKEEEVSIEISTDEELDQDEKYPENATRDIEQLIEESSDKELFHAKLKRLEKESLRRFENKWTGIISKYSNINDDRESDEIDLVTGEIVTNNGHLNRLRSGGADDKGTRRLTTFKLWKQQAGNQQDETMRNRRQKFDQRVAKQREKSMRRMRISSPSKAGNRISLTSGDSLRNVSPTKGQVPAGVETDESPTKKRKIFVQQDTESSTSEYSETEADTSSDYSVDDGSEADNTVEEDASYEQSSDDEERDIEEGSVHDSNANNGKIHQKGSSNGKYFKQFGSSILNGPRLVLDEGPLSRSTLELELSSENERASSPTKTRSKVEFGLIPMKPKKLPSKLTKHRQVSTENLSGDDNSIQNISHLFLEHSSPKPIKVYNWHLSDQTKIDPSSFLDESSPMNSPQKASNSKLTEKNGHSSSCPSETPPLSPSPSSASCESFEEQISIVEEPYYFLGDISHTVSLSTLKIFNCCVINCSFCTMNRKMYSSHLIKHHSDLLYKLGYPVDSMGSGSRRRSFTKFKEIKNQITHLDKKTLLREFPLRFNIPVSTCVHKCDKFINGSKCQMFYLHAEDLTKHKQSGKCSFQTQIIFCPILGCGYMTDGGYKEWRNHLIDAGHCEIGIEQNKRESDKVGDVSHDGESAMDDVDGSPSDDSQIIGVRSSSCYQDGPNSMINDDTQNSVSVTRKPSSEPPSQSIHHDSSKHNLLLNNLKAMTSLAKQDRFSTRLSIQDQVESDYESIDKLFK